MNDEKYSDGMDSKIVTELAWLLKITIKRLNLHLFQMEDIHLHILDMLEI